MAGPARHGIGSLRERLLVLLIAWPAPPSLPGFFVCLALTVVGIPIWLFNAIHQEDQRIFSWWVLFAPFGILACLWFMQIARVLHVSARRADSADAEDLKFELPRAFAMHLKQSATPEVLALDEEGPGAEPEDAASCDGESPAP